MGWRGHLWQGRFASFPMDEAYLLAVARYVELNPVRAKLAQTPEAYPWSSAKAHVVGEDDDLVKVTPLLERIPEWQDFLAYDQADAVAEKLYRHERTGRPLGSDSFVASVTKLLGRDLKRQKPGPKPKEKQDG